MKGMIERMKNSEIEMNLSIDWKDWMECYNAMIEWNARKGYHWIGIIESSDWKRLYSLINWKIINEMSEWLNVKLCLHIEFYNAYITVLMKCNDWMEWSCGMIEW